jgi:GH15 family glucan-1,4-alpha-glucosidase
MTFADFTLAAGETRSFCLTWFPSHREVPPPLDTAQALEDTEKWWRGWVGEGPGLGDWDAPVIRSLITLKALTYSPTGAIVAAPTMGLPEKIGGARNWDYRYCWIRDSTLTLYALLVSGHAGEAKDWRQWLLRAAAGDPSKLQIMYGLHGERRLTELTVPWLDGYEGSRPVRLGNEAHVQLQLDVYGELMDTLHVARKYKLESNEDSWRMQKAFIAFVGKAWSAPDSGIWEMRGPPQHFTHSKIMAWVAIDRAIKAVEMFGLEGPVEEWRALAAAIHDDVCAKGFNRKKGHFVQVYGGDYPDASLLLMAQLGFLPPDDPRYVATVEAVERELKSDGLILRYRTEHADDGLAPGEGAFLACSFWLVDAYVLIGRYDDAAALFNRLLALRNDLGLLAEEYDPEAKRQLGNFPQAFSHIALINSAHNLASHAAPAKDRADGKAD